MKNIVKILAVFSAVLTLTGCGEPAGEPTGESTGEPAQTLHEMKVEEYVTVGDYENLAVEIDAAYLPTVEDSEIYELMNSVYLNYVTEEDGITDRAVKNGDTVIIDYVGKKDGVAFDGGTASGASLGIGSGQFIDGFEDGLIGVTPGETVDLDLTFPENYGNAELAGAKVVFTVTVHYILPTEIPEKDMKDSVVAAIGLPEVENVAQYRAYVEDYLETNKKQYYDYAVQDGIIGKLLANSQFQELPADMIQKYQDIVRTNLNSLAAQNNVTPDIYCNYVYQMDSESYIKQYGERYLQQDLIFQTIANSQGLTVQDEELDSKLAELAAEAGASSVEEYIGTTSKEDFRNYFMNEKVMEYLMSKTSVSEKTEE